MRVDAAGMTAMTAPSQLIGTGTLTVTAPVDLRQSLAFLAGFPPCAGEFVLRPDAVTTAFTVGGRAVAIRLTAGDAPAQFRSVVEGCCWFVISQRTPQSVGRALQRRIRDSVGRHITVDGHRHVAFPSLAEILALWPVELGDLLRNQRKGEYLFGLLSAVDRLGEDWLREAPYAEAYAALRAVRGVGEFTASAVMLRALGRMDGPVPPLAQIADAAATVYGHPVDPQEIQRRYGAHTGYWSYYLKAGYSQT